MTNIRKFVLTCAVLVIAVFAMAGRARAADPILSGATSSATGQKLDGVTVSAKKESGSVTTSVYTDATGNYYFPPLPAGKYNIWAQALGFEQSKAEVDLAANKKRDLSLKTITDPETAIPIRGRKGRAPRAPTRTAMCSGWATLGGSSLARIDTSSEEDLAKLRTAAAR